MQRARQDRGPLSVAVSDDGATHRAYAAARLTPSRDTTGAVETLGGRGRGRASRDPATPYDGTRQADVCGRFEATAFLSVDAAAKRETVNLPRGKEVFGQSAIERMESNVYAWSTPAIRTDARLGFTTEGVRRPSARVGGERGDTTTMALLRQDWPAPPRDRGTSTEPV